MLPRKCGSISLQDSGSYAWTLKLQPQEQRRSWINYRRCAANFWVCGFFCWQFEASLVNRFLLKLMRISEFSSLFLAIAVFSAHFARESVKNAAIAEKRKKKKRGQPRNPHEFKEEKVNKVLLTVELFYLQGTTSACLLTVGAFLLTLLAFLLTVGASLLTMGKCV